jgi:hypothetical protein
MPNFALKVLRQGTAEGRPEALQAAVRAARSAAASSRSRPEEHALQLVDQQFETFDFGRA